ncbi:YeeE/YedE family protein [Gayadomonas joobiniege]|uniref:YeeE/YedE family protein n=1 Tax=Gayadomonas joobiniege TaxID=1234606 RepID=UPI00037829C2|nr:YeeE/YedE thiosulfate transporter family protein [Gayadomonas joobiniege]
MTDFTPYSAILGGSLIGLSALLLLIGIGRIAGISGIVSRLWQNPGPDLSWRLYFIVGLIIGPIIAALFGVKTPQIPPGSPYMLIIAGFLVGFGTVYGSGCTSGHGVCGLSRLSRRSIVATLVFILTAMITVALFRG